MNEQVLEVMRRSHYRLVEDGESLEQVFRLRHKCYLAEGAITPNERGIMNDVFDGTDNCVNLAIEMDGKMLAAVRLHLVSQLAPYSPTLNTFPEVMEDVEAGLTILDPTRFVVDPMARLRRVPLHFLGVRVPLLGTMAYDTDLCLIPVRPEHAAFYRRYFKSEPRFGPRAYLGLNKPLQLEVTDVRAQRDAILAQTPVFGPMSDIPGSLVPFPSLSKVRPRRTKFDAA